MKADTIAKLDSQCGENLKTSSINCESLATTGVHKPICRVAEYVLFYEGRCPYSGCTSCAECAPTKLDEKLLILLAAPSEYLYQA